MRSTARVRVAANAETLRLKALATRTVKRAIFGAIALVFGVATLVGIHVALAIWLVPLIGAGYATFIVLAVDIVVAIIFGLLAAFKGPGSVEKEAYQVRLAALQQLRHAATTASMIASLSGLLGNRSLMRLIVSALMTKMFAGGK